MGQKRNNRGETDSLHVDFTGTLLLEMITSCAHCVHVTFQAEILVQCLANMGLLSVPLMLQSSGYITGPLTALETLGWGLWLISLGWEHLADSQKLNFAR